MPALPSPPQLEPAHPSGFRTGPPGTFASVPQGSLPPQEAGLYANPLTVASPLEVADLGVDIQLILSLAPTRSPAVGFTDHTLPPSLSYVVVVGV